MNFSANDDLRRRFTHHWILIQRSLSFSAINSFPFRIYWTTIKWLHFSFSVPFFLSFIILFCLL